MRDKKPSYEEIEARLAEAEVVLAALRSGVVDAIIGDQHVLLLRVKEVEERLVHLSLVLRAIRSVNQLIVREKNRDRLIQGACDCLIETRGYHHVWIALIDEMGGGSDDGRGGVGRAIQPPGGADGAGRVA